jgi:hypothetical protein
MAALTLYDQIYIELNGQLLAENTSINTDLMGDDQDVETTVKGWAGISPAPKKRTISGENVIPASTGIEVKMEEWFLNSTEVTARLVQGGSGKSAVGKGFMRKVSVAGGVGQTTKVTFEMTVTPSAFA